MKVRRVGDVIKFGLSTRLYLFGGPEELRPAEGLTKVQKRQLAALEVWVQPCARNLVFHLLQLQGQAVAGIASCVGQQDIKHDMYALVRALF